MIDSTLWVSGSAHALHVYVGPIRGLHSHISHALTLRASSMSLTPLAPFTASQRYLLDFASRHSSHSDLTPKLIMKTNVLCLCLTLSTLIAPSLFGAEPTPSGQPPAPRDYTLVFSDDFSTDPNSNGQWTVSRRQGDLNQEGYWDATKQVWYLTRQAENLAVAAFANYELTARSWKVDFKYRVDKKNTGADGFIFMFYKDKAAYGTPDSGSYMGFQTRNANGTDNPVPGYGLQFDTYQYVDCDPVQENYVAIVEDVICNSAKVYRPFEMIDDNIWHSVEFTYRNRRLTCVIDDITIHGFVFDRVDYTYTGIGFGAGTGGLFANQIIDDFQIWVENGE